MRLTGLWNLFLAAGLLMAGSAQAQADNTFARAEAYRAERAAACRGGDLDACAQEGQNFAAGVRAPQNLPLAIDFLGRACDGGRLAACVTLGKLRAEPGRPQHQPQTAFALFERACAGGEVEGCTAGAFALRNADGATYRDWPRAESFLRRACDRDDAEACLQLGATYFNGAGMAPDKARAAEPLARACMGGRRSACASAVGLFGEGGDVPRDLARTERLMDRGCGLGDAGLCHLLGQYLISDMVPRGREPEAVEPLSKACDSRIGAACRDLGYLLGEGVGGVAADTPRARRLLGQACQSGDWVGCMSYGSAQAVGTWGPVDREGAESSFRKALEIDPSRPEARAALDALGGQ